MKIIYICIGIFFVAIVGFAGWKLLGKTENEFSEWETYQSAQWPLSFLYPKGWELSIGKDNELGFDVHFKYEDPLQEQVEVYTEKMPATYQIDISQDKNPKNLSARDFYLDQFADNGKQSAQKQITGISVGPMEAILYDEGAGGASGPSKIALVTVGDKAYRFTYSATAYPETHEKFMHMFNHMLDSVSFAKK